MRKRLNKREKRIISAVLAVILAVTGMSIGAYASNITVGKIDGFNYEVTQRAWGSLEGLYAYGHSGDSEDIEVYPGEEIRIPLTADLFTWDNGRTTLNREAVRVKELTRSRVTVRTMVQSGADALDYVQLDTDKFSGTPFKKPGVNSPTGITAYISVMFTKELVDVNDRDFCFDIYLNLNGEMPEELRITVAGTLKNNRNEIGEYTTYYNTADGTVLDATENASDVEFYLGNGVTLKRNVLAGRSYYATSGVKPASDSDFSDEIWPAAYPTIESVYSINTVNMRYGKCKVTIDAKKLSAHEILYVYSEDMRYFGTTDEELVYSDVYFLSTEKIEIFETTQYVSELENAPVSDRVTTGAYEDMDIDEAKILAIETKVTNLQQEKRYREGRAAGMLTTSSLNKGKYGETAVGYSGEKVDGNVNEATINLDKDGTAKKPDVNTGTPKAKGPNGADVSPNVIPGKSAGGKPDSADKDSVIEKDKKEDTDA